MKQLVEMPVIEGLGIKDTAASLDHGGVDLPHAEVEHSPSLSLLLVNLRTCLLGHGACMSRTHRKQGGWELVADEVLRSPLV